MTLAPYEPGTEIVMGMVDAFGSSGGWTSSYKIKGAFERRTGWLRLLAAAVRAPLRVIRLTRPTLSPGCSDGGTDSCVEDQVNSNTPITANLNTTEVLLSLLWHWFRCPFSEGQRCSSHRSALAAPSV